MITPAVGGFRGLALYGVSCTSAGNCTAVGQYPLGWMYVTESSGVWGHPAAVPGAGAGALYGVSCTDATDCTAVGTDGNYPAYATETAGTWGPAHEVTTLGNGALYGVSCADATDCTAVGFQGNYAIYVTESSGVWSGATVIPDPRGNPVLSSVSCTDATDCTAVGYEWGVGVQANRQPIYATETSGSWSGATEISAPVGGAGFFGISCIDATDCTAVGYDNGSSQPFYATETSGSWSGATEISAPYPESGFNGISCTDATDCTAVGTDALSNPIAATESGGIWGAATEVFAPSAVASGLAGQYAHGCSGIGSGCGPDTDTFYAVSCTSATDCTAVGVDDNQTGQPIAATETSGVWGAVTEFLPDSAVPPRGQFYGVSCASAGDCTAVGEDNNGQPIYATETSGVWGAVHELTPVLGGGGYLNAVNCTDATGRL